MVDLDAHLVADELPIRRIRTDFKGSLLGETSTELFYAYKQGHVLLFNYGVVVFANIDAVDQTNFIAMLRQFVPNALEISEHREDFSIQVSTEVEKPVFDYNQLIVPYLDENILRLTMLQVAQSTALDYYQASAQSLLDATTEIVGQLERSGALHISKRKLLQFIGKTMNTKNRIFDNLYVLDSPPHVWESELLGKINSGLHKTFDLSARFREIDYMLKMIGENLSLFVDLMNSRESHRLEWIIIALILFEVFHLILTGIFKIG